MKRLALALFGLAVSALATGCCCLGGGSPCGPCGGGAYYGPTPGPAVVPGGGCPGGNCGIGAATPAYGISQASITPAPGTAQFASAAPAYTPTAQTVTPVASTATAQPVSSPVIMQAGGFQSGPQFTQAGPGIRMNALLTY